jgi:hypothetical protein
MVNANKIEIVKRIAGLIELLVELGAISVETKTKNKPRTAVNGLSTR